jgi:hypothetical protein
MKVIDLSGKKFGRLTVIQQNGVLPNGKNGNLKAWLCRCACGSEITVVGRDLRSGNTSSCGCFRKENTIAMHSTHRQSKHPLYRIWGDMKKRCNGVGNEQSKKFYCGVECCAEWNDFESFFEWAEPKWSKGLVLDRINTFMGYSPWNCRFVTSKINNQNTKRSKYWFIFGVLYQSSNDAAKALKCSQSHIYSMCHGRHLNGKFYPPNHNCYAVKKYQEGKPC